MVTSPASTFEKCKAYGITKRGAVILLDLLSDSRGHSRRRDIVCVEAAKKLGSKVVMRNCLVELLETGFVKEKITPNNNTQLQIVAAIWNRDIQEIRHEHKELLSMLKRSRHWHNPKKIATRVRSALAEKFSHKINYRAVHAHLDLILRQPTFERNDDGCVRIKAQERSRTVPEVASTARTATPAPPEARPERLDHVFEYYAVESFNAKLDKVSDVIVESLQNSRTGRLSLDILRPLVLDCLELDDSYGQNAEAKMAFEKRFFDALAILKENGRITQSRTTIKFCEMPHVETVSFSKEDEDNASSTSDLPSLPDLPDENLVDEMPVYEDEVVEHDEETLGLLDVMRNRTEQDDLEKPAQEELDSQSSEQSDPPLVSLEQYLSNLGGENLTIVKTWGELVLDAALDGQRFSCTVKHLVESNTLVVRSLLPLDEHSVWEILQATGESTFASSIGTARHNGATVYVVKKDINLNAHSITDVAHIVMQVLSEVATLNSLVDKPRTDI